MWHMAQRTYITADKLSCVFRLVSSYKKKIILFVILNFVLIKLMIELKSN